MNRSMGTFLAFSVLSLGATLLTTGLQEKAFNQQTKRLNTVIDEVEQDMGIYDEETARNTPALKRALNMSREMQKRADEQRSLMDSLARMELEANGDYSYTDSTDGEY